MGIKGCGKQSPAVGFWSAVSLVGVCVDDSLEVCFRRGYSRFDSLRCAGALLLRHLADARQDTAPYLVSDRRLKINNIN